MLIVVMIIVRQVVVEFISWTYDVPYLTMMTSTVCDIVMYVLNDYKMKVCFSIGHRDFNCLYICCLITWVSYGKSLYSCTEILIFN